MGLLSVFLIIGQIVGSSLAGGIVGGDIDDVLGYRNAYLAFAVVAAIAMLVTVALAPRTRERHQPPNLDT